MIRKIAEITYDSEPDEVSEAHRRSVFLRLPRELAFDGVHGLNPVGDLHRVYARFFDRRGKLEVDYLVDLVEVIYILVIAHHFWTYHAVYATTSCGRIKSQNGARVLMWGSTGRLAVGLYSFGDLRKRVQGF